jgi:hypothetical protein
MMDEKLSVDLEKLHRKYKKYIYIDRRDFIV